MSYMIPIAYPDPPYVIDTSITPLPAYSAPPLQIIADTGINTGVAVSYNDSTGDFIGVYIGSIGQEALLCIIGNGLSGVAWGHIPANSRISLKSMTVDPVTTGLLNVIVMSV